MQVLRYEGEMELPLLVLPLCCHSLITGYFHHLVVLPRLGKLPKPKLGKSARVLSKFFTAQAACALTTLQASSGASQSPTRSIASLLVMNSHTPAGEEASRDS